MNNSMFEKGILIVDDEVELLDLIEISLRKEGFKNIYRAERGKKAIEIIDKENIELAVLDVMLPDMEGYDICRYIRLKSNMPVIFLSAKGDEEDRIIGLATGADDYVSKPFSIKELILRIKIKLKRVIEFEETIAITDKESLSDVLEVGDFTIDKLKMEVKKKDQDIELKAKEYKMFLYMAENKNQIISKERFCNEVWGEDFFGFDNTITVHIRRLREKIEEDPSNPEYIKTVKGLGYKLVIGE
ncbi:response regulator transcription factor [Peptostreptococcus russellii]|uniref:Stage 0 sporulation protein A homolog n=1 Tax=Peptostreptococcus russellii TaxID=215200 RepID=A0A1H8KSI9_9FIRM|nr:response regulator transcription factor [Peptostreptococcus russellii]SEN95847.1 DNA-binding response regulator, OmpR family, contains REC and winged-helix (wHTH) domain [Peptostreptococcus russellii]